MNTLKYFFSRSIQTIHEYGLVYFMKVFLGKIFGKNLEFINFIFQKGSYYFRGSEIGFAMIRDSYKYMEQSDFSFRYNVMVTGLDEESKKTIDLFIKHIRVFYHNNIVHEREIFSDRENRLQKQSIEFMGKYNILHPTGYGIFEDSEILSQIGEGDVFDVGASDGIESMMFAKLLPKADTRKVFSFEPSSYNFSRLEENIGASEFQSRIFPQQIALGEQDGKMDIFGSGGAEVSVVNITGESHPFETVTVQKIDTFVKEKSIQRVGLIKWDIEGSEIESLMGGKETIIRDKPVLIISIYHNGREFFETKPLIETWNLGYRFKVLQSEPGGTWVGVVLICY